MVILDGALDYVLQATLEILECLQGICQADAYKAVFSELEDLFLASLATIDEKIKGSKMLKLLIILTAVLTLTACEATKGLGRDLQSLGQALDDAI